MSFILFLTTNLLASADAYGLPLPFTGDHSKLGLVAILMGVALVAIIVVLISSRRKP